MALSSRGVGVPGVALETRDQAIRGPHVTAREREGNQREGVLIDGQVMDVRVIDAAGDDLRVLPPSFCYDA
jgi:hypothetical protein